MDLTNELPFAENCNCDNKLKRKLNEINNNVLKKKAKLRENNVEKTATTSESTTNVIPTQSSHQKPKQKLELFNNKKKNEWRNKDYKYGNYPEYYNYRNKYSEYQDIRLKVFHNHREIFQQKNLLDIGCNSGFITMQIAKEFHIKDIIGIDIDRHLIKQANKKLVREKKLQNSNQPRINYPFNIRFVCGNYVLADDVLLEIEEEQFDIILCLSVTKWIHLNFGDDGLKQIFKRIFAQLRPGGKLILEAQPFKGYSKRKSLTDEIHNNFKTIKFFPKDFDNYLLSAEIGYQNVELLAIPEHYVAGFRRPIQIFTKPLKLLQNK